MPMSATLASLCRIIAAALLLPWAVSVPARAHNGAVAIAVPVTGITIDGDLSDWPEGLRRYPIVMAIGGEPPRDEEDCRAAFRLGYNSAESALYVAMEVHDQSTVLSAQIGWERDGMELYLDPVHRADSSSVYQPTMWGEERKVFRNGIDELTPPVDVAVRRLDGETRYEWRLDMAGPYGRPVTLDPGTAFGLDVVVYDKDDDGSLTTLAWGPGSPKYLAAHTRNRGDAVLGAADAPGRVTGQVRWQGQEAGPWRGVARVRFQSLSKPEMWVQLMTDGQGAFATDLPAGRYSLSVVEDRQQQAVSVEVQAGTVEALGSLVVAPRPIGRTVKVGKGRTVKAGTGVRRGLWQHFNVEDGLPANVVYDVFQDRQGYLWFGTPSGLCRYDGAQFTTFTVSDGLPDNAIHAIEQDSQGALWLGTEPRWWSGPGGGATRYDGDHFTSLNTEDGLADNFVTAIGEDREGMLWFGTADGGVSRFDGTAIVSYTAADGLIGEYGARVEAIVRDSEGQLWVRTRSGAYRFADGRFVPFVAQGELSKHLAGSPLLWDSQGDLWLSQAAWGPTTPGYGISRYDGRSVVTLLGGAYVHHLFEDRDGGFWISEWYTGGLTRYDGGSLTKVSRDELPPTEVVNAIAQDREGHLWVATNGGVSRYDGSQFTKAPLASALSGDPVTAIVQDPTGTLWFGGPGGLSRYDGDYCRIFSKEDGLPYNDLLPLCADRRGGVWAVWPGRSGVSYLDGRAMRHFTTKELLGHDGSYPILAMLQDQRGTVWFGTYANGAIRYDGQDFVALTVADGLPDNDVRTIAQDQEGNLWFGASRGVSRYDGHSFRSLTTRDGLPEGAVQAILQDRQGAMWFGYLDGGVARYDGQRFTSFDDDGLGDGCVGTILEDRRGHLWFTVTNGGVVRYDGTVFQRLTERDGLPSDDVRGLLQDLDGAVWIATGRGAVRYRPDGTPPGIRIMQVSADRQYGSGEGVRLPSTQKRIAFEFQGISFKTRPQQMVYLYRLEGHETEWQQTRSNQAEYENLPVGQYVFQVKAVDRDLVYSTEPATVAVEVFHQAISSSVHISDVAVQDVFASFYKTYAQRSIGSVQVTNDDASPVDAALSVYLPDLMRRPSEQKVTLAAYSTQEVPLQAVLDEGILELQGAKPFQAEVALSCQVGEQTVSVKEAKAITVYGRGALTWDDLGRAAAFVTPEDPQVSAFARGLADQFHADLRKRGVDGSIPTAMLLYEALSAHGVRYTKDSSTPYSQMRGNRLAVDNIQYPSELLASKRGDCDDLTVLYCSLLENLDIPTALIDAPSHILMMFDAGIAEDRLLGISLDPDRYVLREGTPWIPVEVTRLGEGSFAEAWRLGAETCNQLQSAAALKITDVREAWAEYPYALPGSGPEIVLPGQEVLRGLLLAGVLELGRLRGQYVERRYIGPLLANPGDHQRRLEYGRTLIESEDYNSGIAVLMPLLDAPLQGEASYLIGYCFARRGSYAEAVRYAERAVKAEPDNDAYQHGLAYFRAQLAK